MPYTRSLTDMQGGAEFWELARMQLLTSLLLVVVALNVAVLVYARTAMRQTEIAVRSALGASRRRIVGQLFVEALVLSLGAAAARFALAQYAVQVQTALLRLRGRVASLKRAGWGAPADASAMPA